MVFLSQIVPEVLALGMQILSMEVSMKKGKKDRKIAQPVRIKNKDNELEIKDHLHSILDKKIIDKKSK